MHLNKYNQFWTQHNSKRGNQQTLSVYTQQQATTGRGNISPHIQNTQQSGYLKPVIFGKGQRNLRQNTR